MVTTKMTDDDVRWSNHAKKRRKQMGLTEHRVEAVIDEPEMTYSGSYDRGAFTYYIGDGLCIPVDPTGCIVTVLWHGATGRDELGGPAA